MMNTTPLYLISLLILLLSCSGNVNTEEMKKYELQKVDNLTQKAQLRDGEGNLIEEGYYYKGKRHGTWLKLNPNTGNITALRNYYDGQLQGISMIYDRLQITERAHYLDGKLDGYFAQYKNGRIRLESNYKEGKLHGRVTKYYSRGRSKILSEADYRNGVQHGIYRYYDDQGNITLDYTYENGQKVTGGIVEPETK